MHNDSFDVVQNYGNWYWNISNKYLHISCHSEDGRNMNILVRKIVKMSPVSTENKFLYD